MKLKLNPNKDAYLCSNGLMSRIFFYNSRKIHNKQRLDLYGYTASLCDCERLKAKALACL